MKEEIRRKHLSAAGSMIDGETKTRSFRKKETRREPPSEKKLAVSDYL